MSRTLRRPMFRRGGSANDGIMSGLEDREKLSFGTPNPAMVGQSARDYIEQFEPLLREFTPKTRLSIGAVGSALVQGVPIKEALAAGYGQFVKRDDAREAAIRKGAVSMGLGQALKDMTPGKASAIMQRAREAIKLGSNNPSTGEPFKNIREAFEYFSVSSGDVSSGTIQQQVLEVFSVYKSGSGGTKEESEFDVLKTKPGKLPIKGRNFGKVDLINKQERENITDNENFGPGDGFFNLSDGKLYILKPGGNKEDFTSNNYEIISLDTLY